MALADIGALADRSTTDGLTFARRVEAATLKAAHNIINEAPTTSPRQQWAKSTLEAGTGASEAAKFVRYALGNSAIQSVGAAATDNDIEFVVAGLITVLVGAQS